MTDPWTPFQNKIDKASVIGKKRSLNLRIQITGVFVLFALQFLGYYFKIHPIVMACYPIVFIIWGTLCVANSIRYTKQINKIFKEE